MGAASAHAISITKVMLIDQLRLAWNARGTADCARLETVLTSLMGAAAGAPT